MISELTNFIDSNTFVTVLLILFIVGYFIYKEWPEFRKRMGKPTNQEEEIKNIKEDLDGVKKRLEALERETKFQSQQIDDSLEERRLLMRGIMACLDGLEQQGCNHTVPSTKQEINEYLNNQAHK